MLINILTYIIHLCLGLFVIVVIAVAALVVDMSYSMWQGSKREHAAQAKEHMQEMMRKEALRRKKEAEAHEGFFEESYIRGFAPDGSLYHLPKVVPTARALDYYKQMDELENTQQFNIVEEIQRDLSNPKDQ